MFSVAIIRTRELKGRLRAALPDLDHLDDPAWIASVGDHAAACDLVKTTVGLARYALAGWEVADALVEHGIVIEKAGTHTITLIRRPAGHAPYFARRYAKAIGQEVALREARDKGGSIVARDTSLATLRVL